MANPWTSLLAKITPPPDTGSVDKPFAHSYPWQLYTKLRDIQLTAQLNQTYPVDELSSELDAVLAQFAPQEQFGHYHHGGWAGVALNAIDGDPLNDQDNWDSTFQKTPALQLAPLMEKIIDSFPCEKRRIRLLSLKPGKKILWHYDAWHSVDSRLLRLHIPITTNDKVAFQISHQDCRWKPGELWYGDFSFPHRLQNGGATDRIHLVIDLDTNDEIRALLPEKLIAQRALRSRTSATCRKLVSGWNHVFATEKRLLEAQKKRKQQEEQAAT